MEGKGFRDRIQEFTAKNTVVLGISFDTPEENKAFKDKFDFPFDLLSDVDSKVGLAYAACDSADAKHPARISYLIDTQGRIKKAYAKVTPATHPDEVLGDLA